MTALALALAYLGTLAFVAYLVHRRGESAALVSRVGDLTERLDSLTSDAQAAERHAASVGAELAKATKRISTLELAAGLRPSAQPRGEPT